MQSQEEFFHTFNTLLEGKQQIIITSDRTPTAIPDVDQRLISRFGGGLTVGIEPPELETRAAILEKKALERGAELPDDVALFIAGVVRSNVRELEGGLHTVLAAARFTNRRLDVELAREALRERLAHQERRTSIENIQQTVAEYYKLRVGDLAVQKTLAQHRAAAATGDVFRQGMHQHQSVADRRSLRRARSHHGFARASQNFRIAAERRENPRGPPQPAAPVRQLASQNY